MLCVVCVEDVRSSGVCFDEDDGDGDDDSGDEGSIDYMGYQPKAHVDDGEDKRRLDLQARGEGEGEKKIRAVRDQQ